MPLRVPFRRAHALVLLAVAAAAVVAALALRGRAEEVKYATAKVDRGDLLDVVGATGTLQAVTTVQVGSQVSGKGCPSWAGSWACCWAWGCPAG